MRRAEFYLYLLPKVDHRGLRARICSNFSTGTGGKSQIDSHCRHVDIMSTSTRYHWSTRMSCWSREMTCWSRRMCSWPRRMSCRPRRRSCRPTTRDHRDDLRPSNNDSIGSERMFNISYFWPDRSDVDEIVKIQWSSTSWFRKNTPKAIKPTKHWKTKKNKQKHNFNKIKQIHIFS